jgi:hypothetical protein
MASWNDMRFHSLMMAVAGSSIPVPSMVATDRSQLNQKRFYHVVAINMRILKKQV